MVKLIEYRDYQIHVSDEAFLIRQIRQLHNADRTLTKENFMKQISYLYFMVDPRSSYSYIVDEEERARAIITQEGLPSDFKPDKKLQEAMDIYQKHIITTSSLLLQDTKIAIDKVRQFLRDIDLNAVDDKGKPLYTINSVTTAIKQIPQLAKDVMDAEKAVAKEIEEQSRARGNQGNKTLMDDGILD